MMNIFKPLVYGTLCLFYLGQWSLAEAQSEAYSLDQALQYALSNSVLIKNSELDFLSAKAKVSEIRGLGLPQIDAQLQVIHNIEIQNVILENDPANPAFFNPNAPAGAVIKFPFQLRNNGTATLNANQLLFDGSYLVGLKAASTYKLLAEKQLNQSREQVIEAVSKAYYGVLVNRERARLMALSLDRVDSFFLNTKTLYENGLAEKIDADRLAVQLNNLKVEKSKIDALVELSVNLLKFQMGYPFEQGIELLDNLEDINKTRWDTQSDPSITFTNRIEYSILQTQRDLAKLDMQNNQAAYLPKLYAFATYGYNPGASKFGDLLDFNDRWVNYSFVGFQMRMNLFTGLSQNYKVQQAKLSLRKAEQSFKLLENSITIESDQARINYTTAIASLDAQQQNVDLAAEVARVTKLKYAEGVGSSLEVTNAENELQQSQINYLSSIYEALIAEIDYKKSRGLLK